MIYIENRRTKESTLRRKYGEDVVICDVTSQSTHPQLIKLSPFYPHGDIPVPYSEGYTATCVEAVWQGLKVFEHAGINMAMFENATMRNLKRTVRRFGKPLGHQRGVNGKELLSYEAARFEIYLPTYYWMLEHKVANIVRRLCEVKDEKTIVLLDYNTNGDVHDLSKPLSHAALIKLYVEGRYPMEESPAPTKGNDEKKVSGERPVQLSLF